MDLVSVIIPSHNRYDNLLNAINSVKQQTYKNYEIIVVDDGSKDSRYKNNIHNVKIINLPQSSKEILGYPCGAVPRNEGMRNSNGTYIAFLDDDDIWMPNKLEIQMEEMKKNNIQVSSTDGYIGEGFYNQNKIYKIYNKEYFGKQLKIIFNLKDDFPRKFNLDFIKIHNPIITSSIIFKKELINKVGYMKLIRNGGENINGKKDWQDWNYWRKLLEHTDCLYIKTPLFYYDNKKYI